MATRVVRRVAVAHGRCHRDRQWRIADSGALGGRSQALPIAFIGRLVVTAPCSISADVSGVLYAAARTVVRTYLGTVQLLMASGSGDGDVFESNGWILIFLRNIMCAAGPRGFSCGGLLPFQQTNRQVHACATF